jgi:hypothetical protein
MIISDAPNCGATYNCHYDDRNSFIIQATKHNSNGFDKFKNLTNSGMVRSENTKEGSITVPLTSCLTGLESAL